MMKNKENEMIERRVRDRHTHGIVNGNEVVLYFEVFNGIVFFNFGSSALFCCAVHCNCN